MSNNRHNPAPFTLSALLDLFDPGGVARRAYYRGWERTAAHYASWGTVPGARGVARQGTAPPYVPRVTGLSECPGVSWGARGPYYGVTTSSLSTRTAGRRALTNGTNALGPWPELEDAPLDVHGSPYSLQDVLPRRVMWAGEGEIPPGAWYVYCGARRRWADAQDCEDMLQAGAVDRYRLATGEGYVAPVAWRRPDAIAGAQSILGRVAYFNAPVLLQAAAHPAPRTAPALAIAGAPDELGGGALGPHLLHYGASDPLTRATMPIRVGGFVRLAI